MKQHLFFYFFLSLLSFSTLSAQTFKGGIRSGMVASEVGGDELAGLNKFGFLGSVFTMYPISKHSFLQFEAMYIQKGSRAVPKEENYYSDYLLSLHYVEFPLLYVQDLSVLTPSFDGVLAHGGFSLSKLVHHKETKDGAMFQSSAQFNAVEANFLLGFSYPITQSLFASVGFSNSITPIRPHPGGQTSWKNRGQYNSIWTLSLAYIIW